MRIVAPAGELIVVGESIRERSRRGCRPFADRLDAPTGVVTSQHPKSWAENWTVTDFSNAFLRLFPSETIPFSESSAEQAERIAEAARELDRLRTGWLDPPEWTREEVLEFYSRRLGQRPVGSLDRSGGWVPGVESASPQSVGT